jgi:hypothetical protein
MDKQHGSTNKWEMNVEMNVNKFEKKITIDFSKGVGDHKEIFNINIMKLITSLN